MFGIDPTGIDFRLAQRLLHVAVNSAYELAVLFAVHGAERPRADQGLVQEVFFVRAGNGFAGHQNFLVLIQTLPGADGAIPLRWNFGEHVDSRANILASSWCRAWNWPAWRFATKFGGPEFFPWKVGEGDSKGFRRASDLVEREQRTVAIERRVLQTLRHDRPGELLEAHDEQTALGALGIAEAVGILEQEQVLDEIEDRSAGRRIAALRGLDGGADIAVVLFVGMLGYRPWM